MCANVLCRYSFTKGKHRGAKKACGISSFLTLKELVRFVVCRSMRRSGGTTTFGPYWRQPLSDRGIQPSLECQRPPPSWEVFDRRHPCSRWRTPHCRLTRSERPYLCSGCSRSADGVSARQSSPSDATLQTDRLKFINFIEIIQIANSKKLDKSY